MKRTLAISLAFSYLTFSVGVVISSHFCNTTFYSISVFKESKSCCSGTDSDKRCCHDVISILKIDDSYDNTNSTFQNQQSHVAAVVGYLFLPIRFLTGNEIPGVVINAQRLKHTSKLPIYIHYRVFII